MDGVKVEVFEGLGNWGTCLGLVPVLDNLCRIDVHGGGAVEIIVDHDRGGEVELRVQCASAMARSDGLGGRELVHISSTGAGAVEALLDAVALVPHRWEGKVNLGDNASHVEATSI